MYRAPSRRKSKHEIKKPNLIPILDAVFIFIFFLLMSANFLKIFEISSDVPIISDRQPPENDPPLALTLKIYGENIVVYQGLPSRPVKKISKTSSGEYDLEELHSYLIQLKMKHKNEKTIILEPLIDVSYEIIVNIMDSIRMLKKTDPSIWIKGKNGSDIKVPELFNNIIFGNIQS